VSRNRNAFKTFEPLAQAIGQDLSGRSAILDDEIVRPGPDGLPMSYEVIAGADHSSSMGSISSWLDGRDLRGPGARARTRSLGVYQCWRRPHRGSSSPRKSGQHHVFASKQKGWVFTLGMGVHSFA